MLTMLSDLQYISAYSIFKGLRRDALKLRGFYLVVQEMARTYVDVSNKYIIPGVRKMDRLSVSSEFEMSQQELEQKIGVVRQFSEQAQKEVQQLANTVRMRQKFPTDQF